MKYEKRDEVLEHFLREMRQQLGNHLKQVILFGSKARGDDVPYSDYDCLAILDEVSPGIKDLIDEIVGEILYQHGAVVSVLPVAEKKYHQQTYNPLLMNVRREGIVL